MTTQEKKIAQLKVTIREETSKIEAENRELHNKIDQAKKILAQHLELGQPEGWFYTIHQAYNTLTQN